MRGTNFEEMENIELPSDFEAKWILKNDVYLMPNFLQIPHSQ